MNEINPFDGVQACFNGELLFEKEHKMKDVDMPIEKLKALVDTLVYKHRK